MAYLVMAYVAMAYIFMAYTVIEKPVGCRTISRAIEMSMGHEHICQYYIGHSYMGHNYIGDHYRSHNYVGRNDCGDASRQLVCS